jgi:hypothetical protein
MDSLPLARRKDLKFKEKDLRRPTERTMRSAEGPDEIPFFSLSANRNISSHNLIKEHILLY